jgi:molecular chaperone GrpE
MTTPHDKKDRRTHAKRGGEAGAPVGAPEAAAASAAQAAAPETGAATEPVDVATEPAGAAPSAFELARAIAERDQYLDHLQRLKAEFENYRKRVQRDNEALVLRAGEGVIESLLPVLDNMARALEAAEKHEEGQLIKGVELVSGQLRSVLEGHGLDEVPAACGLPFDPNVHEAVVAQDSDEYAEGQIVTVLEAGYLLHGRLLRPARVIVAR